MSRKGKRLGVAFASTPRGAGSERNMRQNIDALRQNANRARRQRGDISRRWVGRHRRAMRGYGRSSGASMRPRRARCTPMIGEGLRAVCLQRIDEGPIVQAPSGVLLHPPTQGPPRDLGTPLSRRPNPCPGRGSLCRGASAGDAMIRWPIGGQPRAEARPARRRCRPPRARA
jgi:hypothetical protein